MRVVVLSESYERGGLSEHVRAVSLSMLDLGHDVSVLVNVDKSAWKIIENDSVLSSRVHLYSAVYTPGAAGSKIFQALISVAVILLEFPLLQRFRRRQLARALEALECEHLVVSNGGFPGGLYCLAAVDLMRRKGFRPVLFVNSLYSPRAFRFAPWVGRSLRRVLKRSTIAVPSAAVAHSLEKVSPQTQVNVVPNYVELVPGEKRPLASYPETFTVVCPAGFFRYKGHPDLIDAANLLSNLGLPIFVKFYGTGDSKYLSQLRANVSSKGLGNRVTFHDFEDDKAELYKSADLVVLPSRSAEAFGLVLVEAMSLGIPVVGSRTGGIPDVIGSEADELVYDSGNFDQMSQIILKLMTDRSYYTFWSKHFLQRFHQTFSKEKWTEGLSALSKI